MNMTKKTRLFWISVLAALLFAGCFTYRYSEQDLLLPQKEHPLSGAFRLEKHFLSAEDGVRIECWFLSRSNAELNILFLPGNSWNLRHRIPAFNLMGEKIKADIFAVNYRGYGLSEGKPSLEGLLKDGRAAVDFFSGHSGIHRGLPTYVLGFSPGSFVALRIAAGESIKGVILVSSMTSTQEIIEHGKRKRIPLYALPFVRIEVDSNLSKLDNIQAVKGIDKPVLFIHGEKDSYLPFKMSKTLYDACPSPCKKLVILEGANHFLCDEKPFGRVVDEITKFIGDSADGPISRKRRRF
jgi:fermentation-respiration switch protein FrsA (DUF1100 family)